MRKIFLIIVSLALVAAMFVGTPNVWQFVEAKQTVEHNLSEYLAGKADAADAASDKLRARAAFDSDRTFDIDYTDLSSVYRLLNAVSGIKVEKVRAVTLAGNFADPKEWVGNAQVEALQFTLKCDNAFDALRVLGKMQLPIVNTTWAGGVVTVTVLSGQEVNVNG